MSQEYCILNLLNIEDKNVKLLENFYKIEKFGQIKYKDFYMKYKGEKNGLKSISDWTHRMNEKIQKETELDENNK